MAKDQFKECKQKNILILIMMFPSINTTIKHSVTFFFFFPIFFYLNIASYYNTYITYYTTDIDIKIQKYKAEIKITI